MACFIILLVVPCTKAANKPEKYVGRSGCAPELDSSPGRHGIRLDGSKRAYLEAYVFKHETILVIVQHRTDTDQCGIVRDAIKSQHTDNSFVFECVDEKDLSAVVVGTWPAEHPIVSGPAVEAWKIDLKGLKFVRVNVPVACNAGNYAGADEGDDLVSWARKRAAKH
jgi:hypothetical protein